MKHILFSLLLVLLTVALTSCAAIPQQPAAGASPAPADAVSLPEDAMPAVASPFPEDKPADGVLAPDLGDVLAAYRAGDRAPLLQTIALFGGDPETDSLRVILEMAVDPEARPEPPKTEIVTLDDGSEVTIEHAPEVAIRADLAATIADAGAVVETAYENLVQVLTPVEGLDALSRIPGLSRVRLPYPAE